MLMCNTQTILDHGQAVMTRTMTDNLQLCDHMRNDISLKFRYCRLHVFLWTKRMLALILCCCLAYDVCYKAAACLLQLVLKTAYIGLWPHQGCMRITCTQGCHSSTCAVIMLCMNLMLPEHDPDQAKVTSVSRHRCVISHEEKVCRQANSQRSANQEIWLDARWLLKLY